MKRLLLACYWIGIVVDAIATLLLFWPAAAQFVLQPQPFEMSALYLYVCRVAGGLMLGWTLLLWWAQREPVARAEVLLLTLLPVVVVLAIAAALLAGSHQVSLVRMVPMFVFYALAFALFLPAYLWARRQRAAV